MINVIVAPGLIDEINYWVHERNIYINTSEMVRVALHEHISKLKHEDCVFFGSREEG
jgi:hypothetical protein